MVSQLSFKYIKNIKLLNKIRYREKKFKEIDNKKNL